MSDLETALIAQAIVRLHSMDHGYQTDCYCADARAFKQRKLALASHGIDFDKQVSQ